jgi:hypothetical protein
VTLHPLSQACVFLYSSRGKWVFPLLLWSFPPTTTFTSFSAPDYWAVLLLLPATVFVYSLHGRWVFPLSCGVFLLPPLSQAFSLLVAESMTPLLLARLVYLQFQEGFPSPSLWRSVHPTLFPICLYCSHCLLLSFSFFPGWRLVCPGGYADLAQGCLWEYRGITKLTLSASSQAVWAWATAGLGALLVSLLNVKWKCSALAGGVEGSKFCLFSVVLPSRCVSSISPRFHYRRHAFCFLPLAAILESHPSSGFHGQC